MNTVENDPIRKFVDDYEFLADCGNAVALTTEQKRIVLEDALHSWLAQEAKREKHAIAEAVAAERERIAAIWDVKAENALECMKSSGKDGRHFQQIYKDRLEIAAAIRSAAK